MPIFCIRCTVLGGCRRRKLDLHFKEEDLALKIHMVKEGDTLYLLAKKYGVELDKVIAMNPQIADPNKLDIGMKVKIPTQPKPVEPPVGDIIQKHTVVQGDTLWKLSKQWGVPLAAMIKANPQLKNPNVLLTGETVLIPKVGTDSPHAGEAQDKMNKALYTIPMNQSPNAAQAPEKMENITLPMAETPFEQFPVPAVEVIKENTSPMNMPPNLQMPVMENMPPNMQMPVMENMPPSMQMPVMENMPPSMQMPVMENMPPNMQMPIMENMPPNLQMPVMENMPLNMQMPIMENMMPNMPMPMMENMLPNMPMPMMENMPPNMQMPIMENMPPNMPMPAYPYSSAVPEYMIYTPYPSYAAPAYSYPTPHAFSYAHNVPSVMPDCGCGGGGFSSFSPYGAQPIGAMTLPYAYAPAASQGFVSPHQEPHLDGMLGGSENEEEREEQTEQARTGINSVKKRKKSTASRAKSSTLQAVIRAANSGTSRQQKSRR
jgi:LysM repeat protein